MPTTEPAPNVFPGYQDSRPGPTRSRAGPGAVEVTPEVALENSHWIRDLSGSGGQHEEAVDKLYAILVKMAYTEARRKGVRMQLAGSELDDIAHQAAADATMTICRKVTTFRGECRFTTWAFRFVQYDVSSKVNRHFWQRAIVSIDDNDWVVWNAAREGNPAERAESSALVETITRIIRNELTDRQQRTFEAIVIEGIPVVEVAAELDSNPNAIYKTIFDARKKLRAGLAVAGYPTAR